MSLFSLFFGKRSAPASRQPASVRLRLESLEDRALPSGLLGSELVSNGPPPPSIVASFLDSSHKARPFKGTGSGQLDPAAGTFFATGTATHLGAFTHYQREGTTLVLAPTEDPTDDPFNFRISGQVTYKAANGHELYATLDATVNLLTGVGSGTDTWKGGTGRFAGASGSAQISVQLLPDFSFTFTLQGDVSY